MALAHVEMVVCFVGRCSCHLDTTCRPYSAGELKRRSGSDQECEGNFFFFIMSTISEQLER